jgi:germination protein M
VTGRAARACGLAALLVLAGCGERGREAAATPAAGAGAPAAGAAAAAGDAATTSPAPPALPDGGTPGAPGVNTDLRTIDVTLYFMRPDALGIAAEKRSIYETTAELDRMKQTVAALLGGPAPGSKLQRVLPAGTPLRDLFVDTNGVAYVDFGQELIRGLPSGSTAEVFAVGALADTLAANFPSIHAVRVLVMGEEVDTLTGHLDLSRPAPVDLTLIRPLGAPAADSGNMPAPNGGAN